MTTHLSTFPTQSDESRLQGPDAAEVLVIVAASIPLPTDTTRALRLTCKATRLAVDQGVKELKLGWRAFEVLVPVGSALTSGLTSFEFQCGDAPAVSNGCAIAVRNAEHLEVLHCPESYATVRNKCLTVYEDSTYAVLAVLGGVLRWPKLKTLVIQGGPGMFEKYINIDSMPFLTELRLYPFEKSLSTADVNALRRSTRFSSTIEILELPALPYPVPDEYCDAMRDLLSSMPRLRHLNISDGDPRFFAGFSFPSLEELYVYWSPDEIHMSTFALTPQPRLRTLMFDGNTADVGGLDALVSNLSTSFPALESLGLNFHGLSDWHFLRKMSHRTLKKLVIGGSVTDDDDVAAIAAGLAQLPALEHFNLSLREDADGMRIVAHEIYQVLFSGPPLAQLRHLETLWDGDCDSDDTLKALIALANKIPRLEKLFMRSGCISVDGLAALAVAGQEGRWPWLEHFSFYCLSKHSGGLCKSISDAEKDRCRRMLQEVWPQVEVDICLTMERQTAEATRS